MSLRYPLPIRNQKQKLINSLQTKLPTWDISQKLKRLQILVTNHVRKPIKQCLGSIVANSG